MTNKEKLKKIVSNDFNKRDNYNKIMKKVEGESMKNNVWKLSVVPMCLIAIIMGVLFMKQTNSSSQILSPGTTYNDKEKNIELHINHLNRVGATRIDAKVKEIAFDELNISVIEIFNDIEIPKELNKFQRYGIYTRKDQNSEYNVLNSYVYAYFNEEYKKDIRIAFSETNKPLRDYRFSEEDSKETIINNIKFKIFQYEEIYFTEFTYKGYNFDIETTNITQDELVNLLKSII